MDYIIDNIVEGNIPFEETHAFVRDRTRAIRQDFTLQNDISLTAIIVHEKIARYHILALCVMNSSSIYSEQQEMEQLNKGNIFYSNTIVMISLMEFYDKIDKNQTEIDLNMINEAEFKAYWIAIHSNDTDLLRSVQRYPYYLYNTIEIKSSLYYYQLMGPFKNQIFAHSSSSAWVSRFFKSLKYGDHQNMSWFLLSILYARYFYSVRVGLVVDYQKSFNPKNKGISLKYLTKLLGYDQSYYSALFLKRLGLKFDPPLPFNIIESETLYNDDLVLDQITVIFGDKSISATIFIYL